MKKLFYIANIRVPTERAHGIQVAHMCSSFASQIRRGCGADLTRIDAERDNVVTLLVSDRKTIDADPFEYYGVERNFRIEKISVPDSVRFGKIGFFIEALVFAYRAAGRVKKSLILNPSSLKNSPPARDGSAPFIKGELREGAIIYTREELPLLFLPKESAFYEAHQLRRSFFFRRIIRRAKGIIAITHGLKDALVESGIPAEKILVAHDGYDSNTNYEQDTKVRKEETRRRLGLPQSAKIAMYIGGLEAWKGAETLCKAATYLTKDNILVALIGGADEEVKELKQKYPNVLFLGAHPYRELPANQQAADVLVIPNSGSEQISREFTSPLKLFAHMASGVPIVASRIPSLCEILSEETAEFVVPDEPQALAEGIRAALKDPAESAQKARKAAESALAHSWEKRAENVLQSMLF